MPTKRGARRDESVDFVRRLLEKKASSSRWFKRVVDLLSIFFPFCVAIVCFSPLSSILTNTIEDVALLGSLQNGFHVVQDQDQRA